ncbi:MAG: low-complexity tail membrane protein [Stenomitos frigidus ULC029]
MAVSVTLLMRSFWFDPYLWIHLAGLAAVPLLLETCLVGFALGDPLLPVWLEVLLVALVGVTPLLWMQWQRPFYIFSLMAVTVKPEKLTDNQRRLLVLFKSQRNRVLAALVPALLIFLLWQLYAIAPIAASTVSFLPQQHLLGLLLAGGAFLACNLFVQVPVSVASVMLTDESTFAATPPYALDSIRRSFTLVGLQLNQLLPPLRLTVKPASVGVDTFTVSPSTIASTQVLPNATPPTNTLQETPIATIEASSVVGKAADGHTEPAIVSDEAKGNAADDLASEPTDFQ